MNQDGIENFFGCVKSFCQNNVNPNVRNFRTGYTTAILSNVTGKSSVRSNCENDLATNLIGNMHDLVLKFNERSNEQSDGTDYNITDMWENRASDPLRIQSDLSIVEIEATSEIFSSICRELLKTISCKNCRCNIIDQKQDVVYPSKLFNESCKSMYDDIINVLPGICFVKSIKQQLLEIIEKTHLHIGCSKHNTQLSINLKEAVVHNAINSFFLNINNILSGKVKTLPSDANDVHSLAFNFQQKKKRIGKYSNIFSN